VTNPQRCLGLDYGFRRIGVALGDPLGIIARPYLIIRRKTNEADFAHLTAIVEKEQVTKIVVGLPTDTIGEIGPQAERVIRWAHKLAVAVEVPISFWDESHSSVHAKDLRGIESGQHRRPAHVDDVAAAVILQEYLNAGGAEHEPGRPLNTLTGAD
jgi:putative holliday junction resolvase